MANEFLERLDAARKTGKLAAKRNGRTVKALTLQLMDGGAQDPHLILVEVLSQRGDLPEWLNDAPVHELATVLSVWGGVRHSMREHGKGQQDG